MISGTIRWDRLPRFILGTLGFVFISLGCLFIPDQEARGQEYQTKPVARLITAPLTSTSSRPWRVGDGTESPNELIAPSPSVNSSTSLADAAGIERRAFEMINSVRLRNGLAPLSWDPDLCRMARVHSKNMASRGFFSHITPDGLSLKDRANQAGLAPFRMIAENIAYNQGYDDPGAFAVDRWMISSGHRGNILAREYRSSAIGVFVNSEGCVYLTQVFISR